MNELSARCIMNHKVEISIIIPAFNEEKRISECLERTLNYCLDKHSDFEIIIAEDGSDDNTVKIIEDFIQKDERIKLITFKERLGKGGAVANAMLTAKKKYVGFMDADLSADPFEFQRLFEEIANFDVVIGSRLLRGNLPSIKRPSYRTLFSYMYSKLFRFLFKIPIYDPQCGFKLFHKEVVPDLFMKIKTTRFAFDSEVVVKAYNIGLRIKEVPIIWRHEKASKISVLTQIKEMGQDLLSVWYESYVLYQQNSRVYSQKKGSRKTRILFWFLSLYKKP